MIGDIYGHDPGMFWAVLLGLHLAAWAYNHLVEYLEAKHYDEGYMAFIVAGGVLLTLSGVAILNWQAALLTTIGFAATGLPMIVGSTKRYVRAREEAKRAILETINNGDETEALAERREGKS